MTVSMYKAQKTVFKDVPPEQALENLIDLIITGGVPSSVKSKSICCRGYQSYLVTVPNGIIYMYVHTCIHRCARMHTYQCISVHIDCISANICFFF